MPVAVGGGRLGGGLGTDLVLGGRRAALGPLAHGRLLGATARRPFGLDLGRALGARLAGVRAGARLVALGAAAGLAGA